MSDTKIYIKDRCPGCKEIKKLGMGLVFCDDCLKKAGVSGVIYIRTTCLDCKKITAVEAGNSFCDDCNRKARELQIPAENLEYANEIVEEVESYFAGAQISTEQFRDIIKEVIKQLETKINE